MNYRKGGIVECSGFHKPEKACRHVIERLICLARHFRSDYNASYDSNDLDRYLLSIRNPTVDVANGAIKKYEDAIGKMKRDHVMHELRECELIQTVE